jgi:hypothetical protein
VRSPATTSACAWALISITASGWRISRAVSAKLAAADAPSPTLS